MFADAGRQPSDDGWLGMGDVLGVRYDGALKQRRVRSYNLKTIKKKYVYLTL